MRFWISWHQPGDDYRPLTYPPNESVLGWWCSGYTGGGELSTLVALVEARSEDAAKAAILHDWPDAGDWRFCIERDNEWLPSDRFPIDQDWMRERLQTASRGGEA